LPLLRAMVAQLSNRLFDESLPMAQTRAVSRGSGSFDAQPFGPSPKGREEVRGNLVGATAKLLFDRAVEEVTARDIAQLASVNHGQIHHYFGSKEALVREVIIEETQTYVGREIAGELPFPMPIDTVGRPPMWRALTQLAMSGDWDEDCQGHRPLVEHRVRTWAQKGGRPPTDHAVLAEVLLVHAFELSWDTYRDVAQFVLAPFGAHPDVLAATISQLSGRLVNDPT